MTYFFSGKKNNNPPLPSTPFRICLLIGVIGLSFMSITAYGFHMAEQMNSIFAPLANSASKTRLETKNAALMFEEMVSSGIVWNFEANWESLDKSALDIRDKIKQSNRPRRIFLPFRAAEVEPEIKSIEEKIVKLKILAKERLGNQNNSLLQLDVNQRYTKVYEDLMSQLNRIETDLRLVMEENSRRFRYTQISLLSACLLISLAAIVVFYKFERRQTQTLLSLYRTKTRMEEEAQERKRAKKALFNRTRALELSNRELEQYTHVVSHDLQEPLRMVTSYLNLIAKRYHGRLDEDADQFIDFAVDGARRMKTMIQALLAYSRVSTQSSPLAPVKIESVLNQVLANLEVSIDTSDAVIKHDPLPEVRADESQLIQLFQNLISNALKFRGEKAASIHIGASKKKGAWLFSVQDGGIGIDPKFSKRIFEIFQRLHTPADYPGTGIGLSICQKIVERHGGRIWVSSTSGKGATFFFTLPMEKADLI